MTENFDLETAIELLPVMTGEENITRQIIDSIDFYNSMLNASSKQSLVNFVLKTRLTKNAKFMLKENYDDVSTLLEDMKIYLLPKKSFVTLQKQLFNCRQGNRSVKTFGSHIEYLFTELTLAQSDGDSVKRNILRPINEKFAIDCFRKGLNNTSISIILVVRQYESLSQAIQTAIDEEVMVKSRGISYDRRQDKYIDRSQSLFYKHNYSINNVSPSKYCKIDQSNTIFAQQIQVSSSDCIPQAQRLAPSESSECINMNNLDNKVMKLDSNVSLVCCNSLNNDITDTNVTCKEQELSIHSIPIEIPQSNNINKLKKKRQINKDIELIIGNNIDNHIKSKKIVMSNEGFCFYMILKKKLYLDFKFLALGEKLVKDVEDLCRNKNIKELKINKSKNSRKYIKKFIRLMRKYNIDCPKVRINSEVIDMRVKMNKVKCRENNGNKCNLPTNEQKINNENKELKIDDKRSNMNLSDNKKYETSLNCKVDRTSSNGKENKEFSKTKNFVDMCTMYKNYDERSVGIT